jgi:hypothetical protein
MNNAVAGSRRGLRIGLGVLQIFIGLGGVAGGWGLLSDVSGAGVGMATEALARSPFPDYLIPGLVLLSVNGVGNLIGGILTLRKSPQYPLWAISLGAFLMAWIVMQVWWIGLLHWLQPLYFGFGLAEGILGFLARKPGEPGGSHC